MSYLLDVFITNIFSQEFVFPYLGVFNEQKFFFLKKLYFRIVLDIQ